MREEIKNWLKLAEEDYDTAKFNFDGKRYRAAAFFCQQAAEKALKAFLLKKTGKIDKIHDLVKLGTGVGLPSNLLSELKELTMDKKKIIESKLKNFKKSVNKDLPITKMYFFGSTATGKPHRYSDIDLIIVSPKFRKLDFFQRGAKMYDYWNFNYPVDFLCYTPEEFNRLKKQATIVKQAMREGIKI